MQIKKYNKTLLHYGEVSSFFNSDEKLFYLDHFCDEWVIGNIDDARQLVDDLQELIEKTKNE